MIGGESSFSERPLNLVCCTRHFKEISQTLFKSFPQAHYCCDGFLLQCNFSLMPIYLLSRLFTTKHLVICEEEKKRWQDGDATCRENEASQGQLPLGKKSNWKNVCKKVDDDVLVEPFAS